MPNTLPSWLWWFFSSILLALIINFITEYSKPKIDSIWGTYSAKKREKNEKEIAKIQSIAEEMYLIPETVIHVYSLRTSSLITLWGELITNLITFTTILLVLLYFTSIDEIQNTIVFRDFINILGSSVDVFFSIAVIILLNIFLFLRIIGTSKASKKKIFYDNVIWEYKKLIMKNVSTTK